MKRKLSLLLLLPMVVAGLAPIAGARSTKLPESNPQFLHLKQGTINPVGQAPLTNVLAPGQRGLYVVQFKDVITDASWKAMAMAGANVGTYLPDFAFLVQMTPEQSTTLSQNNLVRTVTRFRPEWKLAPGLSKTGTGLVRLHTFDGDEALVSSVVSGLGANVKSAAGGQVVAELNRGAIMQLANHEGITFIDEVRPMVLNNDIAAGLMKASASNGPWINGLTGTGQIVGIADTGLDTGNTSTMISDLATQLQITPLALGRTGDWSDTNGHGTHVAGSVLGTGAHSSGLYKGMAYGAKLVFQSVLDSGGGLGGLPADLNTLFSQSASYGAKIHSNSWGQPLSSGGWVYDANAQQVDQYTWNNKGFTILFAAGNDGSVANSVTSPSTAKNAISIGASENDRPTLGTYSDNPNTIAVFSSRGNTPDGRLKPDVVNPGTWIASTRSSLAPAGNYWGVIDAFYAYDSGTSMATPLTAGATTLVRQFYTDVKAITPSASLLKATLINGAQDLGYGWMSKDQGWGRVDLANSLFPVSPRANYFDNETTSLATGGSKSYSFNVTAGQIFKTSLVWTDYAGAVQAAKELVNDLDLQVTGPTGSIYKGNCFVSNTASTSCAAFDRLNNVENVYFSAPTTGVYTVKVSGFNVPNGPQPFSLVASGNGVALTSGDIIAPTTSITAPLAGATVSGTTSVTASASDAVGVTKVEFYLDGALQSTDTTSPYAWSWNTTTAANGTHSLTSKAYDAALNVGTSTAVSVTVSNTGDVTAPTTSITAPLAGATVSATTTVNATASDAVGVTKVEFYLDSVLQSTDTTSPYSWSWNTTTASNGTHSLTTKAYDAALNVGTSTAVSVTVSNTGTTSVTDTFTGTISTAGTSQFYYVDVSATGTITTNLSWPAGTTDLDLYLWNPAGTQVASSAGVANPESITYTATTTGRYKIEVYDYSGSASYSVSSTHTINSAVTGTVSQAGTLAVGASQSFPLTVGAAGTIDLSVSFPAGTDFDLYLLNSVGTTVASAISSTLTPETISYQVTAAGTYTMKVTAYAGSGAFTLSGHYPK